MTGILRAEFNKLISLPRHWALVAVAVAWSFLWGWLAVHLAGDVNAFISAPASLRLLPAVDIVVTALMCGSEFTPQLRSTLLAVADRRAALAVRWSIIGVFVCCFPALSAFALYAASALVGGADCDCAQAWSLTMYLLCCCTLVGVLCDAMRSGIKGVFAALGLLWLAPMLSDVVWPDVTRYMPFEDIARHLLNSALGLPWVFIGSVLIGVTATVYSWLRDL